MKEKDLLLEMTLWNIKLKERVETAKRVKNECCLEWAILVVGYIISFCITGEGNGWLMFFIWGYLIVASGLQIYLSGVNDGRLMGAAEMMEKEDE